MGQENHDSAPGTSAVITISREVVQPDYVTWSTFNLLFMNWCCLGFIAYVYSVKSRDRKMVGDATGAQAFASNAKCMNISALAFSLVFIMITIIVVATVQPALTLSTLRVQLRQGGD